MTSYHFPFWNPDSWKEKLGAHMPEYDNSAELDSVLSHLDLYPQLVLPEEISQLRAKLAKVAQGNGFILQAGDCAELFSGMRPDILEGHYRLLHDMATNLEETLQKPVVRIGRIAGQYGKPRSQPFERIGNETLSSYCGDIVNGIEFTAADRRHDPKRLESAYFHAAASLNYLRALNHENKYYVSHEALILPYEQTQLQQDQDGTWFCCSGHFLWIGERTRQLDSAHVEFLRGVHNPIGVKVGPSMSPDELICLIDILNPNNEPGKLSLITRFGINEIEHLPTLLRAVEASGRSVLWICDPMHGNGYQTPDGIKTRHCDHILSEIVDFVAAHRFSDTQASGIHLELSSQDVTECLGGPEGLEESDLPRAYHTSCDPRLNPQQARDIIDRMGLMLTIPQSTLALKDTQYVNLAERLATARPDSDRLCYIGSDFSLSYRQLNHVVRKQAAWLSRENIATDERILLALDDGPELVITFYAVLAIGALPIVVNPRLDTESLMHFINDFSPTLCFGQSSQSDVWPDKIPVTQLNVGDHLQWLQEHSEDDNWNDFIRKPWDAPVLIQCTSGSTGRSKGVVHSAQSMLAVCQFFAAEQLGLSDNDILYSPSKSFFGYGMGNSLFFPLFIGACCVLDATWPSAERVTNILQEYRPTVLFAVPNLYRALLDYGLEPASLSIRLAFSAGSALPASLAQGWKQHFGFELYDGIGCTELGHIFATNYPDTGCQGSVGRMLPSSEALIVDAEGQELPHGECGRLLVKTPSRAVGYWNRLEQKVEPFQSGWYCTGDLFSQDKFGYLNYYGREDDRFKVNGRWVVPTEIENAVMGLFPALGTVFIVPVHDLHGEEHPALIISGTFISDELMGNLNSALEKHLVRYKRPIAILTLDNIPTNKNNKPDRRAMAKLASTRQLKVEEDKVW
ncbi:3-deoxy-7-phosphoheptulonate synthase [Xenorhabdus nematophila]|uniref:3-deoxy-7-phosphoheptulonate synthase n=1 Tax=Xenorhabdus nematophila TaxID=628 RepID=UPI000543D62A|nr:3-deoxy-7-phosphoheptulonate synthase [Xenorhabdus nematophila]CEF29463.1 Phospho-2-dehydro-3-deoxyheptonate aldolase 2, chloroplastic (modular protein) [Xenorhabdus nematophila str. Websteri]